MLHGEIWGMSVDKCACPIGMFAPYGDQWAFQMHGGMIPAPAAAPATSPPATRPAPAATNPPATPPANGAATNPPPPVNPLPLPEPN
jgi:hypothetical protein